MKFKLALFVCLLSQLADAKVYLKTAINSSSKYLYTTEKSENTYKLSQFEIKKDQLQDFKKAWYFKTDRELQLFLKALGVMSLKGPVQKRQGVTEQESKQIWPVKNNWSLEYEKKYAAWVRDEIDVDFFLRHKIVADCADVAYTLRWIFARMNYLPMAVTLVGSNVSFTNFHFKDEWLSLEHAPEKVWSEDPVFMASLNYVLRNTSTESVPADTAYVKPTKEYISEGVINFSGSHTQVIKSIDLQPGEEGSYFTLIESLPTRVPRKLYRQTFYNVDELKQFHWALVNNDKIIQTKNPITQEGELTLNSEDFFKIFGLSVNEIIKSNGMSLVDLIEKRVNLVQQGFDRCQREDCSENTANYEEYSTFSSDKRIFKALHKLQKISEEFDEDKILIENFKTIKGFDLSQCQTEESDEESDDDGASFPDCVYLKTNRKISFEELLKVFKNKLYSSDPRHSKNDRWMVSNDLLRSEMNKKIEKRKKIVEDAEVCRQDKSLCGFGTEKYYRYSTYELDQELKENLYRFNFSLRLAKKTKSYLEVTKENEAYKRIFFFDSNALSSKEARLGINDLYGKISTVYSDEDVNFSYFYDDGKITFTLGNEVLAYPWNEDGAPGECTTEDKIDGQHVFLCADNIIILFDHKSRKKYRILMLPLTNINDDGDGESSVAFLGTNIIAYTINSETKIYRLEGAKFKLVKLIANSEDLIVPDELYKEGYYSYSFYAEDDDLEQLKFLKPKELSVLSISNRSLCAGDGLDNITLFQSDSKNSFLAICEFEEKIRLETIDSQMPKFLAQFSGIKHVGNRSFVVTKNKKSSILHFDPSFTSFKEIKFSALAHYFPFVESEKNQWDLLEFVDNNWVKSNTYASSTGPVLLGNDVVKVLNPIQKAYQFISKDKTKIYESAPVANFDAFLKFVAQWKLEEDVEVTGYMDRIFENDVFYSHAANCVAVPSGLNENLVFIDAYCAKGTRLEKVGSSVRKVVEDENFETRSSHQLSADSLSILYKSDLVHLFNLDDYEMNIVLMAK